MKIFLLSLTKMILRHLCRIFRERYQKPRFLFWKINISVFQKTLKLYIQVHDNHNPLISGFLFNRSVRGKALRCAKSELMAITSNWRSALFSLCSSCAGAFAQCGRSVIFQLLFGYRKKFASFFTSSTRMTMLRLKKRAANLLTWFAFLRDFHSRYLARFFWTVGNPLSPAVVAFI